MGRVSGVTKRIILRAGLFAAVLLVSGGCKKEAEPAKVHVPPPAPTGVKDVVKGRITYHGVGLPSGSVQFFGESGKSAIGAVMMGGTYTVWNPPQGSVKITVTTMPPKEVSKAEPAKHAGNVLPPRYADPDSSGLTFKVTGGEQTFNIALTD